MQNKQMDHWEREFEAYLRSAGEWKDGSHDLGHFKRVWATAQYINREEGGTADEWVLLAAAYFHDLVSLPKNHPERATASRLSAERTALLLQERWPDFPREKIEGIRHAIHAHSFSARVAAETMEAKILQDADRMEALGAIGLARVFYTAGQLNMPLFDEKDPLAEGRTANDQLYSLDHFAVKLLKLPAMMNTATGRRLAEGHAAYLREFLGRIGAEIAGDWEVLEREAGSKAATGKGVERGGRSKVATGKGGAEGKSGN